MFRRNFTTETTSEASTLQSNRFGEGVRISTVLSILSIIIYTVLVSALPFFDTNHLIDAYVPGPFYVFGIPAVIFVFGFVYASFFTGYSLKKGETPF